MECIRRDYNSGKTFLKMFDGKKLVSTITLLDTNTIGGYIQSVSTAKRYRRHGYGSTLLEQAIKIYKNTMCVAVRLHVLANNEPAIQLYKKHGFFIVYKTDDDFYLMVKKL